MHALGILACLAAAVWPAATEATSAAASWSSSKSKWAGATTYPTTVTRIWSRTKTLTPTATVGPDDAEPTVTSVAVSTVTMYDPWPSSPNPEDFPYTLTQTAITKRRDFLVRVAESSSSSSTAEADAGAAASPTTTTTTVSVSLDPTVATRTVATTWVIWNTSPTDLPVGRVPGCHGGCAPVIKPDRRCTARGLATACHSQCKIRHVEGWEVWWCQQRGPTAMNGTSAAEKSRGGGTGSIPPPATTEVAIGRVCTDSVDYYEQLLEPCDHSDHRLDCPPCAEEESLAGGGFAVY